MKSYKLLSFCKVSNGFAHQRKRPAGQSAGPGLLGKWIWQIYQTVKTLFFEKPPYETVSVFEQLMTVTRIAMMMPGRYGFFVAL